jgi:hypothetical protein
MAALLLPVGGHALGRAVRGVQIRALATNAGTRCEAGSDLFRQVTFIAKHLINQHSNCCHPSEFQPNF